METTYAAPAGTCVGHVHLRVTDLERSIAFYEGVLGFAVQARMGDQAAFLGAAMTGGQGEGTHYHHHIGLNTWSSRNGSLASPRSAGLFHTAFLYPDRAALARAVRRVIDSGTPLSGTADHGVSEAVYLDDPDGNGVELYRDRSPAEWPRDAAGNLAMVNEPLDVAALIAA